MQKTMNSLRSRPLPGISATGISLRSTMFLVLALGVIAPFSQHNTVSTNTDADPRQKSAASPQSAGWAQQTSGTSNNLFSVHFVNANEGWAVGSSNTILHTTNGGTSWSAQANQGGVPVSSYLGVRFIDSNTGWAGGGSAIVRTTDGGASWVSQGATQDGRFRNNLFAVSSTAAWIPTQNAVSSVRWFSRFTVGVGEENFNVIGSSAQYADIYFTDADNGWSVGSGPIVRITQGSGGSPSFSFQTSCPCPTMNGIHMLDTSTGWAVGNGGLVLKTTNGGGSWISQTSGTTTNLRSVHFANANQGWAVGAGGLILMSTDGGASWTQETSGVTTELRRVFFVDASTGYAVGHNGAILKRTPPPMTFIVTNTNDSGPGSLRQAILNANANPAADTITFNIPNTDPNFSGGVFNIHLTSSELILTDNATFIDGASQTAFTGDTNASGPEVVVNGDYRSCGAGNCDGLVIQSSNNRVHSLVVNRMSGNGIRMDAGATNNTITACYIGTTAAGLGEQPQGGFPGVVRNDGNGISSAGGNIIGGLAAGEGNVISNNGYNGDFGGLVLGSGDQVKGNKIGTDPTGTVAAANYIWGIAIDSGTGIVIEGNLVSGNSSGLGIQLSGPGTTGNVIKGNKIGTDITGTQALANASGVYISNAPGNVIGGTTAAERNLISGNLPGAGVTITDSGATGNVVRGNFIGTDINGTASIRNRHGVLIVNAASGNTVGGTVAGARNIISGNITNGVIAGGTGNFVQGNFIGTDVTGTAALRNLIGVSALGTNNTIGGTSVEARNVISGNERGVEVSLSGNLVQGNFIGTKASGTEALANTLSGVYFNSQTTNALIGGTATGAGNVISGNGLHGVEISQGGSGGTLQGNFIGTDLTGTLAIPNSNDGVFISSAGHTVGGTAVGARNLISGNSRYGINISFNGSGNMVQGNLIGLKANGTDPLPNSQDGINISGSATGNTVGGASGAGNVIAGNGGAGVFVSALGSNAILSNSIFSNGGLGIDLAPAGVTPNDSGDTDTGPNGLQNFPVLTSVTPSGANTIILGMLQSVSGASFTIQFFSNATCDSSGRGEGAIFIGETGVTTGGTGLSNFSANLAVAVAPGRFITATATDAGNNTSEFSPCLPVPVMALSPLQLPAGTVGTSYNQTISASGGTAPYTFAVTSGALPPGLTLSTAGGLSGTPVQGGNFTFTVTATDAAAMKARRGYNVAILNPAPCSVPGFTGPTSMPAGSIASSVAVRDFNGDNKLDLAVTNANSNNVSIYLGNGAGGFGAAVSFATGSTPWFVFAADFNGDNKLDLVTANNGSVSILLGNGAGGFGSATDFPSISDSHRLAVGDFNTDGKLDLAVASFDTTNVAVLLGDGTGGFGAPAFFNAVTIQRSIVTADFNGDGALDIAVTNSGQANTISVLLGNGAGGFGPPASFVVGNNPWSLALGDFNEDGKYDLAVGIFSISGSNGALAIVFGDGAGGFGVPYSYSIAPDPEGIAVGDLNADGHADIAVAPGSASYISVFFGDGMGSFNTSVDLDLMQQGLTDVAIADLNGDGRNDLAFTKLVPPFSAAGESIVGVFLRSCCPTITLSPSSLPNGVVGTAYNQTITASGGTPQYTFAVTAGALPDGLALSPAGGISGIPSATGNFNFTVTATDVNNCSGSRNYAITISAQPTFTLTVNNAGGGIVTSNPAGINCGATCSTTYNTGTLVTLTATPDAGAIFAGWVGACTGTGSCMVTMDSDKTVTARFVYPLTVTKSRTGNGTIASNPVGINCGATCTANYDPGTMVTLSATPDPGSTFTGWSGGCSGTGSCIVTMNAARSVTANFVQITISPSTLPGGSVGVPYNQTITASGGSAPYTFAITAGSLPSGLALTTMGALAGTPTASGSYTFTVTATDAASITGSRSYTLTVDNGWKTTGSMGAARRFGTLTLLSNGKVLATGGIGGGALAELYDPNTGLWSATASMSTGRYEHTATMLPSGKVLVVGGNPNLNSAELYDPTTGTWSGTGTMTQGRYLHTATLLTNGRVLVAGGFVNGVGSLASAEIYNPATGMWSSAGNMGATHDSHTATLLSSGKVLVAGGDFNNSIAELFDPSTGLWSVTANMNQGRYSHTATLLPNGKVLVASGGVSSSVTVSAELFDPAGNGGAGSWSMTANLNTARRSHTATLLPSGKVLVTGGYDNGNTNFVSTEVFDPAGNGGQGSWGRSSSLTTAREEHIATLLASGKVLVAGGADSGFGPIANAELYNPAAGNWAATESMSQRRDYQRATLLASGKVLVTGGDSASAELYDLTTAMWTGTGSLSMSRLYHTATLLPSGKVLVAGGRDFNGNAVAGAELYDPATGMWSSTADMHAARLLHTATLLPNGTVLVTGGQGLSGNLSGAELFDPAGNGGLGSWTLSGAMNAAHVLHTATLLPGGRVLVAGTSVGNISAELYDSATGQWGTTGNLSSPRAVHTATLLPNGKVLVVGGQGSSLALNSAESYDPATGMWSTAGSLFLGRQEHTAALLPDGRVLIVGGVDSASESIALAEVFDPATGLWGTTASTRVARRGPSLTLLPSGKVLVVGGANATSGYLDSAELYDSGLGFENIWRPGLNSVTSPLTLGSTLAATGNQFRGISEASGGGSQNSSTNYPLVQIFSLANEQSLFLLSDPASNWSNTSFTSQPMPVLPPGYALATVFTNGIPSTSRMTLINCSFVISPTSRSFTASGGSDSVMVATSNGCSWTALANSGFISILSGNSGNGNGSVSYQVSANTAQSRTGTMTIAGYTFTVTQDACIAPSITTPPSNQIACSGSSASFAVVAAGSGITYRWRKGGMPLFDGGNISGAATDHLTIGSAAAADAGSYDVVVSGACNPPATSMAATLTVNAPPLCSIDGPSSACPNQTNTFVGPFGNNLNYSWSISGNGTISGSTTSPLVSVSTTSAGSFTLTLIVTDTTTGCSSSCMKTVPIAAPTPCSITGANAVCADSTGNTFTGPSGTLFSYVWFVSGNGSIVGGNIGQSVSVTASGAGSFTLTLNVTNANGCNSSCNKMVTVNANPSIILDRDHQSFAANGGNGTIAVTASDAICPWTATTTSSFITINSGSPGAGNGTVQYSVAPNPNSTIRNGAITVGDQTFTIYQGINFADVPSNDLFYNDIGKLAARGVTVGCGAGNYCPNDPVTREQMAAFIMRAKGEFNPPPPSSQRFNDVPPQNVFYNFIDRMAVLGITVGCTPDHLMYCPSDPVKREQMSAFLLRGLGEFNPPIPPNQLFNDVPPQNVFYNFIDRLAVLQITLGCTPDHLMYCPNDSVTRAQMAAFLVRAFNL